jgi:hypothetical protein
LSTPLPLNSPNKHLTENELKSRESDDKTKPTENIDTFSHYSSLVASGKSFFHFIPHLIRNETRDVSSTEDKLQDCAMSKIDTTRKLKLINDTHPAPPTQRMKLKALHHSILVKAEFFMSSTNEIMFCSPLHSELSP